MLRALVIDDEAEVAATVGEMLEREGLTVTLAADGADGLRAIERSDYDIVLADLKMPGTSGAQLYERLGAARPDMLERILFITGDLFGLAACRFLEKAGRPVLNKPFGRRQLRAALVQMSAPGPAAAH